MAVNAIDKQLCAIEIETVALTELYGTETYPLPNAMQRSAFSVTECQMKGIKVWRFGSPLARRREVHRHHAGVLF